MIENENGNHMIEYIDMHISSLYNSYYVRKLYFIS